MANVYGYVRVSTVGQKLEVQIDQIKRFIDYRNDFNLIKIFEDKASGKDINRPGYAEMLELLDTNPHDISLIVISKLDRIGRNLRDILELSDWLNAQNIGLVSIADNIDTTTTTGKLFFHITAVFAEYELARINERTAEGRLLAIQKNVKFGRKPKAISLREVKRLKAEGVPLAAIARRFEVSRSLLYRRLNESNGGN